MLTRLDKAFVPFALFIAIKFIRVLITKTALTKLLENALDGGLALRGMSDEGLGCLMKSLLSQSFAGQCPAFWELLFCTLFHA